MAFGSGACVVLLVLLITSAGFASAGLDEGKNPGSAAAVVVDALTFWDELKPADRVPVLDEYAAWLRLNGLPIAGPSNATDNRVAVLCSEPEAECATPIVVLTRDAEESSLLFHLPRRIMFGEMATTEGQLQGLLDGWLKAGGAELKRSIGTPQQWQLIVLVMHLLHEALVNPAKSLWLPWLRTLPGLTWIKSHHGLFFSPAELACLDVQTKRTQRAMARDVRNLQQFVHSFCKHVNLAAIKPKLAKGADPKTVKLEAGTGCHFTEDQIKWAYAIIVARQHQVSNRLSVAALPLLDAMPYSTVANVRPGMLTWALRDGTIVDRSDLATMKPDQVMVAGIEFISTTPVAAGDVLTFRTRFLEPSDALLTYGRFAESDYEGGVQSWIQWDNDNDDALKALNCTTATDALRITREGEIMELMLKCAELNVIRSDDPAATRELRAKHDYNSHDIRMGSFDFLLSHADLAINSLPNAATAPTCFTRATPMLVAIEHHLNTVKGVFEAFRAKTTQRKEQRAFVQEAAANAMRNNVKAIKTERATLALARAKWVTDGRDAAEFDLNNPVPEMPEELATLAQQIDIEEAKQIASSTTDAVVEDL